jgi:hypothetical protein
MVETPTALLRADEAETLISEAHANGELLRELSPALIAELDAAALLRPLLLRRLRGLVLDQVPQPVVEAEETTDSDAKQPDPRLAVLAKAWFEAQVDRHYLQKRDALERVSFRLLRSPNKGVVLEAQQRLLNQEEDWSSISERWGLDPEKRFSGRIAPIPPSKVAPDLSAALRRLKPGELSQPIRLGKMFALVELEQWLDVELNNTLRAQLEQELLEEWFETQLAQVQTSCATKDG